MSVTLLLVASHRRWVGYEARMWELLAYAGRYGRQPISELLSLTVGDLTSFVESLAELVRSEKSRTLLGEE